MSKAYYEGHEIAYQNIEAKGGNAWRCTDFDDHQIRDFVLTALARVGLSDGHGKRCLVLGVGTGPMACELAKIGFNVHGVDISETAIKMAKKNAAERNLTINYWVGDICRDDLGTEQYDIILDSHCLHCIVTDVHRETAFSSIHRALKRGGHLILHIMLRGTAYDLYGGPLDEDGTLWMKLNDTTGHDFAEAIQRDDDWFAPTRRLVKDQETLNASLHSFGFEVTWSQTVSDKSLGLNDYEGICTRR